MNNLIPTWRDGELIAMDKLEAHRRGLLHKAVSVFVLAGEEVLIQRRALCKYHTPGLWANTCCTHPRMDEAPEACAHRRLEEELGLTGLPLEWRERLTYRAEVGNGLIEHERVDVFTARLGSRVTPVPNPEEVMETAWVPLDTLCAEVARDPDAYTPWLRLYLSEHADRIFA